VIDKIKGKTKWVKSTDSLAGLTLFFGSILFFVDLFGGRYLLTERDLAPYFIPPRFFWVESIKHGNFPLWNPYQFSGHPFFANPQHGMLYPLNGLLFLLPFDVAFNAIIILHFFLGGLFTYLLLKDLRVNPAGALISGLIFMLSGYLLSVHSLLTILLSSIWTPLIMMFFRRAIGGKGFKNEILAAIFLTLSFLGGGIEIVYGNFFILLLMAILSPMSNAPFAGDEARRYRFISSVPIYWRRITSVFVVSVLFLALSAIQLFPFVELFYHSIRRGGISYQEATTWSFAPKDILLFFLPDAYGYFLDMKKYWVAQCWFKTLYTGGLPFILSLIFFLSPGAQKHVGEILCGLPDQAATEGRPYKMYYFGKARKLYLSLMLFSIFLSLGRYNPLYSFVFKYLPFFNGIRYPVKFLYIFILVLSITAGLGFQRLTELSKEIEHKKYKNLLILFSFICVFVLLFLVLGHKEIEHFLKMREINFPQFNYLSVNLFHAKRFFFYLALFFLLIRIGIEVKWKGWASILIFFFLMADLFGNMGFYGMEKTSDYFRKTRILEMISSDRDRFRIFSTGKTIAMDTPVLLADPSPWKVFKEKHLPSLNLLYQLQDIWGIDVVRVKRTDDLYKAFIGASSISATHLIELYGVKYVVSLTPLEGDPRFEMIYGETEGLPGKREDLLKENTVKLYKVRSFLPRAWLVKDFKVMDSRAILSMMTKKEFKPGQEVFLEEAPKWNDEATGGRGGPPLRKTNAVGEPLSACLPRPRSINSGGPGPDGQGLPHNVEIVSETNNRLQLFARSRGDRLLVLSDTYYPGWKAVVDGNTKKIYRADYAFRAIPLGAGTHQIEFVYDPASFKLGIGVTILGIFACIGMGWVSRRQSGT
jgi:hypothetical protein